MVASCVVNQQTIGSTQLRVAEVESTLQNAFGTNNTIESFNAIEIGNGKGYMSQIIRLSLKWINEDGKLPQSVIVKIPSTAHFDMVISHDSGGDNDESAMWFSAFAECMRNSLPKVLLQHSIL
jgi:hypothetical protein